MNEIAVLGAGAMGGLFGGLIAETGRTVDLIDVNAEHIAAITAHGLHLTTEAGERDVQVAAGHAGTFKGPVDLLIVFTKTQHTAQALESARHLIGPQTWGLTVQNGLDGGERLTTALPRNRIAIGMTNWPSEFQGPGRISSHGSGEVRIWSLDGQAHDALSQIATVLTDAGLNCKADPEVVTAIWEKVSFNAVMNSLAAISGFTVGQMADSADIRAIAYDIVREAVATAHAAGVNVDEARIRASMEHAYADHRAHRPSMLQDLLAGRRTEIDAINGAIAGHAHRHGVAVPVIETLARLVRAREQAS